MTHLRLAALALLAAVAACSTDPAPDQDPGDPQPTVGYVPLAGIDPTLPDDDLLPAIPELADKQVIGLGESVHTSGGFYWAKDRLFRFLVERLGVRVFAWETGRITARRIDDYVRTCDGSPSAALQNTFGVFAGTEAADLLQWMCDYNQAHPDDRLEFWGFDIQWPIEDANELHQLLTAAYPSDVDTLWAAVDRCDGVHGQRQTALPLEDFQACGDGLAQLQAYLDAHQAAALAALGAHDATLLEVGVKSLQAWNGESYNDGLPLEQISTGGMNARDAGMAYVFEALRALDGHDRKIALWAHNFHLARQTDQITGSWGSTSMGTKIASDLGADYAVIGFEAGTTHIDWPGIGDPATHGCDTFPTRPGTVNAALGAGPSADYLLFADSDAPWFDWHAETEDAVTYERFVPAEQYDALLYLTESPAMQALYWDRCD